VWVLARVVDLDDGPVLGYWHHLRLVSESLSRGAF
jgi:hypothetical protein